MTTLNCDLPAAFDLGATIETLESVDAPPQCMIRKLITALPHRSEANDDFFDQQKISISLEQLEHMYATRNYSHALGILKKWHGINWANSKYLIMTDDPNLTWNVEHHYIDLWICVAGHIGVSLLCPSE